MKELERDTRSGFVSWKVWISLALLAAIGFTLWQVSLPFRLMRPTAQSGAQWEVGRDFLAVGPVKKTKNHTDWAANSTMLHLDWLDLLTRPSIPLLEAGGSTGILPGPETLSSASFTAPWKSLLHPESFPFNKIEAPASNISIDTIDTVLETDLTLIRNRAGAIETTGTVRNSDIEGSFFLRLGWDTLESGGNFEGLLRSQGDRHPSDWILIEPLKSFASPFSTMRFEGSIFLGPDWTPLQTVTLLSGRQLSPTPESTETKTLSLSGSYLTSQARPSVLRFLFLVSDPEETEPVQMEILNESGRPIQLTGSIGATEKFSLFTESWNPDSAGRLIFQENNGTEIPGKLVAGDSGGLVFLPETPLPDWRARFALPGIFAIGKQ